MRFAKVFFALLFGAVFLITLMKVLFFALFAAVVFGGASMARRAFLYRRMERSHGGFVGGGHPFYAFEQSPFGGGQSAFAQPLNPDWQKRSAGMPPAGRRIEVI